MRAALVLLALVAAGCSLNEPQRAGAAGVSVELPKGWHALKPLSDTHVTDPVARVVVSSGPIVEGGTNCQIADFGPGANAVSVVVVEWQASDSRSPPRPVHFTDESLPVYPPPAIECFSGSGGAAFFDEHGRAFGAYVMLGPRASAELAEQARTVLDTLRVDASR